MGRMTSLVELATYSIPGAYLKQSIGYCNFTTLDSNTIVYCAIPILLYLYTMHLVVGPMWCELGVQ